MTCKECQIARSFAEYTVFNPACIHCGARIIQLLGRHVVSKSECATRRKAMLMDWVAHGHSEQQIRNLVKEPFPIIGPASGEESDHQKKEKPRSRKQK